MPPRWSNYSLQDWSRLKPLVHAQKTLRYKLIDRLYSRMAPRVANLEDLDRRLRSRRAVISIAFDDPQTIDWQIQLVRRYLPKDVVYVIADNSRNDDLAFSIGEIATRYDVPYVRLPENPWRGASRAHGIALNWVWRNVIRPHCPTAFGLLDDDIFPTAADDPFLALRTQPFFGVVRTAELDLPGSGLSPQADKPWFLWAGFSFFRFADVAEKSLDFGQDWFSGMDTGGANWDVLYRHFRRTELAEQPTRFVAYKDGVATSDAPLQWCGPWLHEIGIMGRDELKADKRRAVKSILEPHLLHTETL